MPADSSVLLRHQPNCSCLTGKVMIEYLSQNQLKFPCFFYVFLFARSLPLRLLPFRIYHEQTPRPYRSKCRQTSRRGTEIAGHKFILFIDGHLSRTCQHPRPMIARSWFWVTSILTPFVVNTSQETPNDPTIENWEQENPWTNGQKLRPK
jgi:hypothetical protein